MTKREWYQRTQRKGGTERVYQREHGTERRHEVKGTYTFHWGLLRYERIRIQDVQIRPYLAQRYL